MFYDQKPPEEINRLLSSFRKQIEAEYGKAIPQDTLRNEILRIMEEKLTAQIKQEFGTMSIKDLLQCAVTLSNPFPEEEGACPGPQDASVKPSKRRKTPKETVSSK